MGLITTPQRALLPAGAPQRDRARVAGLEFDRFSEAEVVGIIADALQAGKGGWVVTPNVDICRQAHRDRSVHALVTEATMIVADGMPLIWASRLSGRPLPERVTGSSLIFSLSDAAARKGRSVYLLGGEPGVAERASLNLSLRYPGLRVAGVASPPVGFDQTPAGFEKVRAALAAASPDIVYVGLGFPKQERLISVLLPSLPQSWFVGCGAAIPFAAGALSRAPLWMQKSGLEWLFRLISEPRRLFRRYVVLDGPYAAGLLLSCAVSRVHGQHTRPRHGSRQQYRPV